jgi:hypothetical protein
LTIYQNQPEMASGKKVKERRTSRKTSVFQLIRANTLKIPRSIPEKRRRVAR